MPTDLVQHSEMDMAQAQAIASLPPDMALMRMENEHIMAVAQAKPRDYGKIKAELFSMIDNFPESAEDAIYNKPVGTVFVVFCKCGHRYEVPAKWDKANRGYKIQEQSPCPRCGNWQPKQQPVQTKKFARGLSIRSAENVRVAFGFNRVSTTLTPLDDGNLYKITGTFADYTNGNVTIDEQIVTPFFTSYDKQKTRIPDDRFFNTILKAEKSKVIREVVLRSVPGTLKAAYEDHCEKTISGLLTDGKIQEIVEKFAGIGVSQDMIEVLLGRPRQLGWTKEDRKQLLGIWNALKDGETTVSDVFGDMNQTQPKDTKPTGTEPQATMEDLVKPKEKKPDASPKPSDDEAITVSQWCEEVAQLNTVKDCDEALATVPKNISEAGRKKCLATLDLRKATISGPKQCKNSGELFNA